MKARPGRTGLRRTLMTEQIAAVLERLSGQPDRFDELRTLLADTALREELLDYTDEVTRETSARFAAKELDRAGFYSQLLQREGRRLKGPDALDAVDEILRQYPQIINAIDMALSRNDAEQLAVFAEHIAHPLTVKSRFKEGEALFEQLLKKAEDLDDRALGISARLRYGQFLYYLSRFDEASTMLAQAAAGAEQEGDDDALARALDFRGHITRDQGSLTAALAHYKRSLEIYRRLGDRHGIRIALFNMSGLARMQFRYSEAKELLQEALEIARDECDEWTLSKIVGSFALIALAEGKLAEAKRGLESAIAIHEKIGDLDGVAKGLGNLANANDDLGNFTEAEQCYRRTIEIYQSLGKRFCVGLNLNNLAYMLGTIGRAHEARELFSIARASRFSF
jgi:tetratricopeptide (TPR) repeat protein